MPKALALYIGKRYTSLRSRGLLVGFISTLSVIGLSLGVAILITALSIVNGFDRELQQRILGLLPHISATTIRNAPLLTDSDWQQLIPQIEAEPGVTAAAPLIQLQGMLLANGRSRGIGLNGIDPELERRVSNLDEYMLEGSLSTLGSGDYNIIIGEALANSLGVSMGDSVTLVSSEIPITILGGFPRKKAVTVSGVFRIGSDLDDSFALVNARDAQVLYRMGQGVHGIRIQVEDLFAVNRIGESLRTVLPANVALRYWTFDFSAIYENIRLSKTMVGLLLFLLVAVAAFNVVVSLYMVVRNKQGDIAILRTMGAATSSIRNIFLIQGLIIGVIGTGIGLAAGLLLSFNISGIADWVERMMGVELISADVYPVNFLPSMILASDVLLVCGASIILCLLATLYPAFSASRVHPAEILRYE